MVNQILYMMCKENRPFILAGSNVHGKSKILSMLKREAKALSGKQNQKTFVLPVDNERDAIAFVTKIVSKEKRRKKTQKEISTYLDYYIHLSREGKYRVVDKISRIFYNSEKKKFEVEIIYENECLY